MILMKRNFNRNDQFASMFDFAALQDASVASTHTSPTFLLALGKNSDIFSKTFLNFRPCFRKRDVRVFTRMQLRPL